MNGGNEAGLSGHERVGFAETRAAGVCSWIVFALVVVYTARIAHLHVSKVPVLARAFEEMQVHVPATTRCMLSPAFLWGPALLAAASLAKELLVRNRPATLAVNGAHLALLVTTCWLIEAALMTPLLRLLRDIGE